MVTDEETLVSGRLDVIYDPNKQIQIVFVRIRES
jgi:hypothetical protein